MNPRRLIPYVAVFLILAGTYVGLRWQQAQKETREQQAKQVFTYKEAEITALTLKRGKEEIQLTRQGAVWEMTKPVEAKTDPETVDHLVRTLADLKQMRDLGPGEAKTFGLGEAGLSISFTAKGEQHRLVVGEAVPGGRGHYARKDDDPNVLMISTGAREALNQQTLSLRDKTLWAFDPTQVKSIKIRVDKTAVDLEKTGAGDWRWVGRAGSRVRADRVEEWLRQLKQARIIDFPLAAPKDLRAAGLAPQAKTQVTLVTPKGAESLFLGAVTGSEVYARLGPQGQVVKVGKGLPEQVARAATTLEDRRLWSGSIKEVGTVVWGASGKNWTAVRTPDSWKITGPDKFEVKQDSQRLQLVLSNFQNLEYSKLLPQAATPGKEAFRVEFYDLAGKPMFNLVELAKKGDSVEVLTKSGNTTMAAAVPQKNFTRWQEEMTRLTTPPPNPAK
ncbi:MAG: DUF4340 domain-containing protein [Deltaproteobacteria bacterium]|nr:DUF4340 domain-containing protein [Deltaproteobacteria bacterium]